MELLDVECQNDECDSAVERVVVPTAKEVFESELYVLINKHVDNGLKKPDLVSAMKWATGNCEFS